jgi:hypothetical protein
MALERNRGARRDRTAQILEKVKRAIYKRIEEDEKDIHYNSKIWRNWTRNRMRSYLKNEGRSRYSPWQNNYCGDCSGSGCDWCYSLTKHKYEGQVESLREDLKEVDYYVRESHYNRVWDYCKGR